MPADVRSGPVAGLRVRRVGLPVSDVTEVRGHSCTTPVRTPLDIARTEPLLEGVVALDVLLAGRVVDHARLRTAAAAQPTPSGCFPGVARATGQAPKSWVHQGPPVPSATPTPSFVSPQSRMLARWPGLSSQASMTASASAWPKAMFSARE